MKLNTFNDVEKRYREIKPLVSKYHTLEDNVRPIADRRRKYERIERVHSNKYILRDTLPLESTPQYVNSPWHKKYLELAIERPPITWEKKTNPGGDLTYEEITVRAGINHSYDTSRYNFLREYLPRYMHFNSGSKHFIRHKVVDIEKGVYVGEEGIVRSTTNKYVDRYIPRPEYRWRISATPVTDPDFLLRFRRKDKWPVGVWDFSGPFWPEPRVRVDKHKKNSLKPHIDKFYEWMCIIGPLMPYDDWDYRERMINEINEHKRGVSYFKSLQNPDTLPARLATEIVMDYNHPLRTHLAWHFLTQTDIRGVDTQEAGRKFRNDFNRRANDTFDLQYTEMVQQEN